MSVQKDAQKMKFPLPLLIFSNRRPQRGGNLVSHGLPRRHAPPSPPPPRSLWKQAREGRPPQCPGRRAAEEEIKGWKMAEEEESKTGRSIEQEFQTQKIDDNTELTIVKDFDN